MEEADKPSEPLPQETRGPRRTAASYLTKLAHGSAPFISAFLLVHLSAPALANIGGSELSSQAMILGREYYQTAFGHAFLVVAPILVHAGAGLAKRAISPAPPRRLASPLALTGYTALLALLPVHYLLHRVFPADPAPPVDALAPAELDYEYVKFGLQHWPARSALLYAGLVACVAWHAAEGAQLIWNTWLGARLRGWRGGVRARAVGVAAVVVPVLSGLFVVFREPAMAFMSAVPRYEAAFRKCFVFRL